MFTSTIYTLIDLIASCYFLELLFSLLDDQNVPPRATSRVPLIAHLLGLIKLGTSYYARVSPQQRSEVFTIGIFNFKIYVINSRRLIPLVQRLSKTLSFTPFQQFAAKVYIDSSKYTIDLHDNPDFMRDLDKATRTALSPGPFIDY
jgi:hypothetical protein